MTSKKPPSTSTKSSSKSPISKKTAEELSRKFLDSMDDDTVACSLANMHPSTWLEEDAQFLVEYYVIKNAEFNNLERIKKIVSDALKSYLDTHPSPASGPYLLKITQENRCALSPNGIWERVLDGLDAKTAARVIALRKSVESKRTTINRLTVEVNPKWRPQK